MLSASQQRCVASIVEDCDIGVEDCDTIIARAGKTHRKDKSGHSERINYMKPKHSLLTTSMEKRKGICANLMLVLLAGFLDTPIPLPFLSTKPPSIVVYISTLFRRESPSLVVRTPLQMAKEKKRKKERKDEKNRKERISKERKTKIRNLSTRYKDRGASIQKGPFLQVGLLFVGNAQTLTPSRCCYFL
jgi:hypothetical protein